MSYLSDYLERLYEPPDNAQAGYRYSSVNLAILHVTSVPQNDEAAIEYVSIIETWYPKAKVMIVEKREAGQQEWRLLNYDETAPGRMHLLQPEPVLMQPQEVPPVSPDSTGGRGEEAPSAPLQVIVPPIIPGA